MGIASQRERRVNGQEEVVSAFVGTAQPELGLVLRWPGAVHQGLGPGDRAPHVHSGLSGAHGYPSGPQGRRTPPGAEVGRRLGGLVRRNPYLTTYLVASGVLL